MVATVEFEAIQTGENRQVRLRFAFSLSLGIASAILMISRLA